MKKIELLAPAKNLQLGKTAIDCGADAVYIGATQFGARVNASNSLDDIKELIEYAHLFEAKVYVTINTLLDENQIKEVQSLVDKLYEINTDAIIIQDMGILELDLPPIPIHASTQCFINTPAKAEFLKSVGVDRVILPRETSLKQMKEFAKVGIELEHFVHGALCVGYSGQCYLSYSIGNRSGNKGNCAQPCRKKYSIVDAEGKFLAKNKYLLSLKDLNLSESIENLIDAGISSFKIEGRLKDENYIKNIVSFYRKKIDAVLEEKNILKASLGMSFIDFEPNPQKTFNRGYTNYCLNDKPDKIKSLNTPKSTGEPIGKVISVRKNSIKIKTNKKISNGDGLCFFDSQNELQGFFVNKVEGNIIFSDKASSVSEDDYIYRNFDIEFNKKLDSSKVQRKMPVDSCVKCDLGKIIFEYSDEQGNIAQKILENNFDMAIHKDKALNNFKKQLMKSGGTVFEVKDVFIDLENIPFISVSELNEIRRELLDTLRQKRILNYKNRRAKILINNSEYIQSEVDYRANISNNLAERFYERHGIKGIALSPEAGTSLDNKVVMSTKLCLKKELGLCRSKKAVEPLFLIDEKGKKFELQFNCDKCEMDIINSLIC